MHLSSDSNYHLVLWVETCFMFCSEISLSRGFHNDDILSHCFVYDYIVSSSDIINMVEKVVTILMRVGFHYILFCEVLLVERRKRIFIIVS